MLRRSETKLEMQSLSSKTTGPPNREILMQVYLLALFLFPTNFLEPTSIFVEPTWYLYTQIQCPLQKP